MFFILLPPENPVPLGAGMNGGKITHTLYMVLFKKGEIMKSFNEWLKSKNLNENSSADGWNFNKSEIRELNSSIGLGRAAHSRYANLAYF